MSSLEVDFLEDVKVKQIQKIELKLNVVFEILTSAIPVNFEKQKIEKKTFHFYEFEKN